MGYQSEAELEERLMQKLESQGYERIKLADYDALVENFRKELNALNQSTLDHELTDSEFKRVMNTIDSKLMYASATENVRIVSNKHISNKYFIIVSK